MKKNKTMRAASGLLIATLLSTSVVSGTYAKYVTSDSGQDQARVAKFGVVASVSGELFGDSYSATTGNSIQTWGQNAPTVSAGTQKEKIVAPGTKNDKGMTFSVTGTPEVSTELKFDAARDSSGKEYVNSDIELRTGTFGVMVPVDSTKVAVTSSNVGEYYALNGDKYSVATDPGATLYELKDIANNTASYKPIVWKISSDATNTYATGDAVLAALKAKFATTAAAPNKDLSGIYGSQTITWEWAFETVKTTTASPNGNVPTIYVSDTWDTILGDMIAAQGGATGYDVVMAEDGGYNKVNYASVPAATNSANNVIVAFTGSTDPTTAADANCAVLTESFGAQMSVVQVD